MKSFPSVITGVLREWIPQMVFLLLVSIAILILCLIGNAVHRFVEQHETLRKLRTVLLRSIPVVIVCGFLVLGSQLAYSLYHFTIKGKVGSYTANAKVCASAWLLAADELKKEGMLPETSERVYTVYTNGDYPDELTHRMCEQLNVRDCWFVIVTDTHWHVEYTLFSTTEITPDEIHPYTEEEMRQFWYNPFRDHSDAIGYYAA